MFHYMDPENLNSFQNFSKLFGKGNVRQIADIDYWTDYFVTQTFYGKRPGIKSQGQAIGQDKMKAVLAAMGEAVERESFYLVQSDFSDISYNELIKKKLSALDPESYQIFSPKQEIVKTGLAVNARRSTKLDWTWSADAITNDMILVPKHFNKFVTSQVPQYFTGTSSGNACGATAEGAKLVALLELLERDAFFSYWWTRNSPRKLSFNLSDEEAKNPLFKKLSFFYCQTDLDAHVILTTFQGTTGTREPQFSVAAACHLNPQIAFEKSLTELIHLTKGFIDFHPNMRVINHHGNFEQTIWDFPDRIELYGAHEMKKAYGFIFENKQPAIKLEDLPNFDQGTSVKNLEFLIKTVTKNGNRLFFYNYTTRDLAHAGLHTYRAFSPDLISIEHMHKFRQLGFKRIYELPKKLNWPQQPQSHQDLNPFPHPFP